MLETVKEKKICKRNGIGTWKKSRITQHGQETKEASKGEKLNSATEDYWSTFAVPTHPIGSWPH